MTLRRIHWSGTKEEPLYWAQKSREAGLAALLELGVYRKLAQQGDPEAMGRLAVLYSDMISRDLDVRNNDKQAQFRDKCFSTGFGLAYYEAAVYPHRYFTYGKEKEIGSVLELNEVCRELARQAEQTGFATAVKETAERIAEAERMEQNQRQHMEEFKRKYYAEQRLQAQLRQAQERRRVVQEAMDEHESRRDWAERAVSYGAGGSGVTLDESYALGEIDTGTYGKAAFIRSEWEDNLRRRLEEEYDAAHRLDEEE